MQQSYSAHMEGKQVMKEGQTIEDGQIIEEGQAVKEVLATEGMQSIEEVFHGRKLALSDDILMSVEKPARYIGGEYNAVMKDPAKVRIRFAFCFPDVYEIGMSHLGLQILYDTFNAMEDVWCEQIGRASCRERVFILV